MKTNSKRSRILYVQKVSDGGSTTGLYELVRGLDKNIYERIVLFYTPSYYREQFEAVGAKVITLSDQPLKEMSKVSKRDIAVSLSRYADWLGHSYRFGKQLYLLVRKDWPIARRIARIIKNEGVDLVHHNNHLPGNRASIMAVRLAAVPQVCHVRMLHSFSAIERYLARSVDAFIYMSKAIEQLYCDLGIPVSKGQVVYDAFDSQAFERVEHNYIAELRTEFGLKDQNRLISNVGRIDWWKGQDYFLQAMAEVIQTQPNTKAVIVGAPDSRPENQAYYQRLQQLVSDLQLSDHIIFTGFRTDISRIMAASEVVVHSSSEPEPFGRVVVEAMLAGRPVIATAAGGVLDIIEDQVTGLLVPPKNAISMARAILRLLQNPEWAKIICQRAQLRATERFSVEQHLAEVQHIYQKILTR